MLVSGAIFDKHHNTFNELIKKSKFDVKFRPCGERDRLLLAKAFISKWLFKSMSLQDARIFSMLWEQTVYLRVTRNTSMDVALDDQ